MGRRKREERIRYFEPQRPPNNDQYGFLHSTAITRAVFGGNRSGKTEIAVADAIMVALGTHPVRSAAHPPPVALRYCAPKWEDNVKDVVLRKFKEMVPRIELVDETWSGGWKEKARCLSFKNGTTIRFFTGEQDVDTYAGADLDGVYMDEHFHKRYYLENKARLVDRAGFMVLTLTPEKGLTWELEQIVEKSSYDPTIEYWFYSAEDNPHLSVEGLDELKKSIDDPALYETKIHGRFMALSGLVLPQWRRPIHFIPEFDIPDGWYRQFIIDPHHRKPCAMLWVAWDDDGNSYAYREAKHKPAEGGITELAAKIRTLSAGERIAQWIGDEAMGGQELNVFGGKSVLEQLRGLGLPVVGTQQVSDKAFSAGISKLRTMMTPDPVTQKPRLYVTQACRGLCKEIERYQYREETKLDEQTFREKVRTVDDDWIDCYRYGVMAEPNVRVSQGKGPHIVLPRGERSPYTGVV